MGADGKKLLSTAGISGRISISSERKN